MTNESQKEEKKKEKTNVSQKKKKKEICDTYLETRATFEGYMTKVLKALFPKPTGWKSSTFLLVTWVNRWSLRFCRCWSIELIKSLGLNLKS